YDLYLVGNKGNLSGAYSYGITINKNELVFSNISDFNVDSTWLWSASEDHVNLTYHDKKSSSILLSKLNGVGKNGKGKVGSIVFHMVDTPQFSNPFWAPAISEMLLVNPLGDTIGLDQSIDSIFLKGKTISITNTPHRDFSLFPNPTMGHVTLALNNYADAQNVQVINSLGQLVLTESIISERTILNMPETGVYFIKVNFGHYSSTQKLIVNN
ncbi:MAG: T9SS type A sorting domain-containing protein, partial [Bacteroidetes bacterium]|nr:T9SS type A sorting domain-containing protein [Bacteroidota bacterium]